MKKHLILSCIAILLCCLTFTKGYSQTTNLIQLDENIYLHPAKNALEVRISKEELVNMDLDLRPLSQQLSRLFKDDFDAYVFVRNLDGTETNLGGYAVNLNNQVKGIGCPILLDEDFATMTRWRGFIMLTGLRNLFQGPLLHEICHLYGGAPDLGQVNVDAEGNEYPAGSHWGISDIHGFLGGFDASTLSVSDNRYQATCWIAQFFNEDFNGFLMEGLSTWKFPPLELYLMGLAPISEVPDVHIYKGISDTNADLIYKNGTFTANEVITYTQEDLLEKWGERIPNYADSPKEFAFLNVILTDVPLTDEQWEFVQEDIRKQELQGKTGEEWPINFWEATGGRGTIKMSDIDQSLYVSITANESIETESLDIQAADGAIVITTTEAQAVQVYGVTGVCHYNATVSGTATIANLPAGIYIVTAGGETLKVAVR